MTKIILWIVVVFVVLFALRLYNSHKQRERSQPKATRKADVIEETMVRCVRCGTFIPRNDAKPTPAGVTCGAPACIR